MSRWCAPLPPQRKGFSYLAFKNYTVAQVLKSIPRELPRHGRAVIGRRGRRINVGLTNLVRFIERKLNNEYTTEELEFMKCTGEFASREIGPTTSSIPRIVDQSIGNHYRGLRKRCAHENSFDKKVMSRFHSFVDRYVRSHYQPIPYRELTHEYLDTWLKGSKYTLKQKEMYHKLMEDYFDPLVSKSKFYRCNSFIKQEYTEEIKEARIINAPNDMLKAVIGPYMHELESQVYDEHFIKHCDPESVYHRMQRVACGAKRVYETDYSSFEGSFTVEVMAACEMQLFRRLLARNPQVLSVVERVDLAKRKLYYRRGMGIAKLKGSRLSGALWTSLANGFTNKMIIEFMAHEQRRKMKKGFHYDYLVEGDDGFIVSDVDLPVKLTKELGFRLKIEEAYDSNGLSFCGLCMGPSGLVPDFWRTINKFGHTFDTYLTKTYGSKKWFKRRDEMMRSKAMSLLAQSRGVPILQPLALKIMDLTSKSRVRKSDFDYWEVECLGILSANLTPKIIRECDREFFAERFHVSVKQQLLVERYISNMTRVDVILPL